MQQDVRKWQALGRTAEKYGPATIQEAQIAVSEVLTRLHFNTAVFCHWYEERATGRQMLRIRATTVTRSKPFSYNLHDVSFLSCPISYTGPLVKAPHAQE